jgi:hypothetical protein
MSPEHHTTMIYQDGATIAVLVTRRGNSMAEQAMDVASAETALAWCRAHAACLVVMPPAPTEIPKRTRLPTPP